jgi:thioredoxin reductase
MTRLGLAYDAVAAINPRIVYASAFGYGQDGPYAAKPAYDDLIQAALGMPVLQAPAGEAPRYMATNIVDRACGREVAVVGSGDAAAQEALHLAGIAAKVVMLARAERLRARESYVHRIAAEPRIEVRLGVDVIGVEGGDAVAGLRIRGRADGREQHLPTSALFVFIGLEPATAWLPASLARDTGGAIITDDRLLTALPRVLAVGACRSGYSGRLDDAIDEARRAVDAALRRPV